MTNDKFEIGNWELICHLKLVIGIYCAAVGAWLSLVERLVRDQEVVGSNPAAPILVECPDGIGEVVGSLSSEARRA